MKYCRALLRWGLVVLLGAAVRSARAQALPQVNPPHPLQLRLTETYVQTDVEAEREYQQAGTPPSSLTHERLLLQPVLGLGLAGSVYHPNLLEYRFNTELGLDYQASQVTPGGSASDSNFLQRYHGAMTLLREKPYATTFYADKDLTYRDYDFFSRVRVDSERYGARSGYAAGPVPFSVSVQHYEENLTDITRPSQNIDDTLSFSARNERRDGRAITLFDYNLDQFSRRDDGFSNQRGLNQTLSISDNEAFGEGDWVHSSSMLNYASISETAQPTDKLLLQENLRLQHTPRIGSFYEYAYDTAASGDANTDTHQLRLGLTHQYRESLTTLDVHGNSARSSAPGSSSDTLRYGVALSEQYNKRLSRSVLLSLGDTVSLDHEDLHNTGQAQSIINEAHTLADGILTLLSLPGVDASTIRVTDPTGTILYQPGLDYIIVPHGAMTEIRRVPGGRIPNGGGVLVDYSAVLNPSAAYSSVSNEANFRLDFWRGLLGLYGRWSVLSYSGGEQLLLRTLNDKTVGVDSTWRWLRVGAEYERADSNISPYVRKRLFQSVQVPCGDDASLGAEFDQNWTTFRDTGLRETSYGMLVRFQQALSAHLSWSAEGGMRMERGTTFDQNIATCRTSLDWAMGKLSVKLAYEYNNQNGPGDLRERHYLFVRIRRSF